ncbi:MAG: addiction module antidote protein, HigA family [Gammaproteobacteria bacterium]|nr:MAG: addiction module antidote protein, HigA family [Gammaproteobacteria bacterium]
MINNPFHPGIFLQEVLNDLGITAYRLAKDTNMPGSRIDQILKQNRGITVDTAMRLAAYLGTTEQYWLNLQNSYDIANHEIEDIRAIAI